MARYRVELEGGCQDGRVLFVEAATEADALAQVFAALPQFGLTPLAWERREELDHD